MGYPILYNPARNQWYLAQRTLGQGGCAVVLAGYHNVLPVAIKIIRPSSNFLRDWATWDLEQRIHLLSLYHQHIVQSYDQFVNADGSLVLVLERADGDVHSLVEAGVSYAPKDVCLIGCQLLSALHHLHSLGIMHRDVTPKNVLYFLRGVFKLNDFGIARMGMTSSGFARSLVGTPSYIPPELITMGFSSFQSDIYQVGLILLSLLTGRHPLPPAADFATVKPFIIGGVPRQTAEGLIPKYGQTAQILVSMLCRTLSLRYPSAEAAYHDLYVEYQRLDYQDQMTRALAALATHWSSKRY